MSEGGEVQASVSRGRPPGSRRSQQAACTPEDSGMSRSTRSRSNSIPTLPTEAVENQRSRKVSKKEESTSGKQSAATRKPGTGRKLSAHGGEADLGEEGWGVQRARESLSTYGSRVMSHLREYEEASKSLRRLREELRYARARADQATKKKKSEIQAEVKRLEGEIKDLEERKAEIREMSGGFKEKLINDDRFREMADNRERRLMGLQPESQVDDDDDDNNDEMDEDQQPDPPGSLQQPQQAPYSGPPAQQSVGTPADSGEDSDSSGQGGALMAQIKMIESPVCPQNFVFGNELPEEAPGGKKGKTKTKAKQQEVVSYIYTPLPETPEPAAGSVHCASPVTQPSPCSVVDSVQRCGENTDTKRALSSSLVCSSRDGAEKASAKRPDSEGGPAVGKKADSGAVVRSPVGGGGGSVPEVVAVAPDAPNKTNQVKTAKSDILFCIGAADPTDQRHVDNAKDTADEAEGTKKNRVGMASRPGKQAVRSLKGPAEVVPTLVPRDAEAKRIARIKDSSLSSCAASAAGPASVNEGGDGGAGCMNDEVMECGVTRDSAIGGGSDVVMGGGDVVIGGGNDVIGENVIAGGGNVTGDNVIEGGDAVIGGGGDVMGEIGEGNRDNVIGGGGDGGVGAGTGPVAPPAVTAPRKSYAGAAAGGGRMPSSSPDFGDGMLRRRFLEALKKGERSINVEGREVDLSYWIERHGLAAFREQRGGETTWSLPTAGQGGFRRNVVRLRWWGSDTCPSRTKVVELLLKMSFKATDIYALIHPHGTPEFDISFVRPEGLELFWSNYELIKNEPGWRDFAVQALSRQNDVKRVTILTRNESLSCVDIMTWLGRYGEVIGIPQKNRDEFGIWSGAWTFVVKLRRSGNTVTHIPSSAFLGRDRIQIFYQGQPKLCHRCGDPTHFSANCTVQKCALCGGVGHHAASCGEIRCHLCGDLGHPFSRCPRSFANAVLAPAGKGHELESAGEGTSRGGGAEGPVRNSKKTTPARLRRLDKRQKERAVGEPRVTGRTSGPVPEANHAAEALRDDELNEEVRRLRREEGAVTPESSHCESAGEDDMQGWQEKKRKRGTSRKKGDLRSSPTLVQVPKEGETCSPLIGLSNQFQALDNISSSEEEEAEGEVLKVAAKPPGGAESFSPGEVMSSGEKAGPESGDEDGNIDRPGDMDTSVSLKRVKSSSDVECEEGKKGGGKKKAIELNHP